MDKILSISGAQILYNDNRSKIENVSSKVRVLDTTKVDGAFVSEDGKYLHLTCNGEDITGPLGPFSGGGGGGGGGSDNNAKLTVTNISGVLPSSIARGSSYVVTLAWSSIEDDLSTGPGSYTIKVNGQIVESGNIPQGNITKDLGSYLSMGDNTIRFTITDVYGNMKTIIFTVKVVEYTLTSKFLDNLAYKGEISFAYTISGEGDKVMHFFIDGVEIGTQTHTRSGSFSYVIPSQPHGAHLFEAYFLVEIGGETIKSNVLSYDLICYEEGNETPIITSSVRSIKEQQYFTVVIPYYVYNTVSNTSDVQLYVNDELKSTLEGVGRELQTWAFRLEKVGNYIYSIRSGNTRRDIPVEVTAVDVDVEAETQSLALYLTSRDRSNNEPMEQRTVWQYKDIKAEFHNFNWATDGWVKDSQNLSVMRVKDDARITIPYKPFGMEHGNIHNTGKTLEFEFATSGVFDYNTSLISCISNGRGFNITAQQALFASSSSRISAQYKENEHVRVSFVINDALEDRLLYCYVNGIISGIIQYSSNEIFYQDPEVEISIGSSDAIIDVYNIRIYDKALSRFQTVNNWIADMQDGAELLKQYKRNNLYDNNYEISLDMVRKNLPTLPYIVVDMDSIQSKKGVPIDHLPQYKGEKLLVSGYFIDPNDEANCFSWVNGELDVQGTSSQAYPVKNFKLKVKPSKTYGTDKQSSTDCSGFIMTNAQDSDGNLVRRSKYSLRGWEDGKKYGKPRSIETNTFVFKADYASSEGANNVELVRFYNDTCPYKTPPQEEDSRIRQGIDGFPCIWFAKKGDKLSFIGKYNFNNHKGTDEVYGFNYHGETFDETDYSDYERIVEGTPDESWEITDNNSAIALWRRVAGTAYKEVLYDNLTGNSVTYDTYLENENLDIVNAEILTPIFNGTFVTENENYPVWVEDWRKTYKSLADWTTNLAIFNIHDSGETMEESIQDQRNFVIEVMKDRIREVFNLRQEFVLLSPEEDMLGEWGKGEKVAHSFEVRFPSEWYDAHTEGFPEVVKTDRMVALQKWIVSTDTNNATNEPLEKSVTYNGVTYTNDTADYRLAKFREEVKKYFNMDDSIFYYIFTETFLMIDSRVKNAFPSYFAVTKEVQAKDEDGNLRFKAYKDKDTIEDGKEYFAQITAEDGSVTYEPFSGTKGDPAKDSEGNPLYKRLMTEEEVLDKDGWPLGRWCWLPYDMDTANGINNEGLLVFDYALEDTEALIGNTVVPMENPEGVPVYNGASSVFWNNLRKAFPNEIEAQYQEIRGQGLYNYDVIEKRFEDHQNEWSASIFNEDAYYKYVKPLLETGEDRLGMCLGSKEQQRKWWMFNRFRFLDSKYVAGDAENKRISFRVNDLSGNKTVTISPYIDLYIKMKQGEQWQSKPVKVYRNKYTSIFVDVPEAGDTEAYIYSADQIKEIQGLNQNLHISTLDVSPATNLQHLDVSSDDDVKGNSTLVGLSLGANTLLRVLNAKNCRMLGSPDAKHTTTEIKMSACEQLEEVYLEGTQILGVDLPSGGRLRKVHLPSTLTTLNLINQKKVEELKIVDNKGNTDYSNLSILSVSNVNQMIQNWTVDVISQLNTGYIKFTDFDLTFDSLEKFNTFIDHLLKMKGPTDSQDPTKATVSGTIHLDPSLTISYERYRQIVDYYRDLTIDAQVERTVEFYNYDGTELLDTQYFTVGSSESGSVTYGGETPTREEVEDFYYKWVGWSSLPFGDDSYSLDYTEEVSSDKNTKVYAYMNEIPVYRVNFYNFNGSELLQTLRVYSDESSSVRYTELFPNPPEGFETALFEGWGTVQYAGVDVVSEDNRNIEGIISDSNFYAQMSWEVEPNSIYVVSVEEKPYKTLYYEGEIFDPTGMEVMIGKVTPEGSKNYPILVYTYDKEPLTSESTEISISYGENNTTSIAIYMASSLRVVKVQDIPFFEVNSEITLEGVELLVTFNGTDATELITSGFDFSPKSFDSEGLHEVTITYKGLECSHNVVTIYGSTIDSDNLDNNSWEVISAISTNGTAQLYWHIGQMKTVTIKAGYLGSSNDENYLFRILSFDHNLSEENNYFEAPKDELGNSKYQHSITFGIAKYPLEIEGVVDDYEVSLIGVGHAQFTVEDLTYTWNRNSRLKELCDKIYNYFPSSLRNVIKPTLKWQSDIDWEEAPLGEYTSSDLDYAYPTQCFSQEEKVFVPSMYELIGNVKVNDKDKRAENGADESLVCKQFDYYKGVANGTPISSDLADMLKKYQDTLTTTGNLITNAYWTRSMGYVQRMYNGQAFLYMLGISSNGYPETNTSTTAIRFYPCFNV